MRTDPVPPRSKPRPRFSQAPTLSSPRKTDEAAAAARQGTARYLNFRPANVQFSSGSAAGGADDSDPRFVTPRSHIFAIPRESADGEGRNMFSRRAAHVHASVPKMLLIATLPLFT